MFFCGRQNFTSYSFFSESYIPTSELEKHLLKYQTMKNDLWIQYQIQDF